VADVADGVIRVDIAMSDLSSATDNTGHYTSDRDPSACRPPALDLQSTDTAAAAPAPLLRSTWRHVTHVPAPKIRHIDCNKLARNLLPGVLVWFFVRSQFGEGFRRNSKAQTAARAMAR
jgi:hypothetical protein